MNNCVLVASKIGNPNLDYLYDNFSNIITVKPLYSDSQVESLYQKIKKMNVKKVILQDYFMGIIKLIEKLSLENYEVFVLWTNYIGTLVNEFELLTLNNILELQKNKKVIRIGFTDVNYYEIYKNKVDSCLVKLNVLENEKYEAKGLDIGVYGINYDWRSNIYNSLSSLKMIQNARAKFVDMIKLTKNFCKLFNIPYKNINKKLSKHTFRQSIKGNTLNLFVEFSNALDLYIIDSFNHGIPCILGNNTLFFKDTELEKYIIVKSDDDIDEIKEKIELVIKNKDKIKKIYTKLKKEYDKESKESLKKFIGE